MTSATGPRAHVRTETFATGTVHPWLIRTADRALCDSQKAKKRR